MNRRSFLQITGAFLGSIIASDCGFPGRGHAAQQNMEEAAMKTERSGKILIAYYSLTGHTRAAARRIQALTRGDLFEIQAAEPYPRQHDPCLERQMREIRQNARPPLAQKVKAMDDYRAVLLGFPIWYYQAPMVINTFVEQHDFSGRLLLPFCTSGGSGIEDSVRLLRPLAPQAEWHSGLRVTGNERELRAWLGDLAV